MFQPLKEQAILQDLVHLAIPHAGEGWVQVVLEASVQESSWEIVATAVSRTGQEHPLFGGNEFLSDLEAMTQCFMRLRALYGTDNQAWIRYRLQFDHEGQIQTSLEYPD